ncbi:fluoride efflux transporter CrcB [Yoonia sp.]|uniref:fluoride efflux transporter CrcB n=1 Tax=Yoonia sp. TaxID=2212373 RepID=UPI002DFBCA81|nr:fluoride efflux transporter CrcB [Yoonia sp.]
MMTPVISVALGGAIGSVLRYLVGLTVAFPLGTLTVNVIGSFAIGVIWVHLADRGLQHWSPFVMTGLLGGFTTFSAFTLDALRLFEEGRFTAAGAYIAGSVVLSLMACGLGLWLAKGMTT